MKYKEALIPKTLRDLKGLINDAMLRTPQRRFEPYEDFDGVFFSIGCGIENLRKKIGEVKAHQLLDMLNQAKAHYEMGENRLGGALMEDAKMALIGRQPWAYPKDLYRWGEDISLPELSEADLRNNGDEHD